jgi:nitronate monooxygenase
MISTHLTERFGIRHPIVCAPMALVTGGTLAAAQAVAPVLSATLSVG